MNPARNQGQKSEPRQPRAHRVHRVGTILGVNSWIWIYLITLGLQLYRAAGSDVIIFGTATILLALNEIGLARGLRHERINIAKPTVVIGSLMLYILLNTLVWHGWAIKALLIVGFPFAIWLVWYQDRGPKPKADIVMKRTQWTWIAYGILVALFEYGANVLTVNTGNKEDFPTLSALFDPWFDNPLGRYIFSALWILLGLMFLRIWRQKR